MYSKLKERLNGDDCKVDRIFLVAINFTELEGTMRSISKLHVDADNVSVVIPFDPFY